MVEQVADFRKQERKPEDKAFAFRTDQFLGRTIVDKFKQYPDYVAVDQMSRACLLYASAYTDTMIRRVLKEEPEFFDDKEFTMQEM